MARYTAKTVDTEDTTLEGARAALQEVLDTMTAVVAVFPLSTSYSVTEDGGNYRDYHYVSKGLIVVGVEKFSRGRGPASE